VQLRVVGPVHFLIYPRPNHVKLTALEVLTFKTSQDESVGYKDSMSEQNTPPLKMAHDDVPQNPSFVVLKIAVLKISDTRHEKNDDVGQELVQMIQNAGHQLLEKRIVKDDKYQIRAVLSDWIASQTAQVVICTGGTGITGRDGTPEAIRPLFDKELEGFGEIFRLRSFEKIGLASMQSRCTAGVANGVYIFCLPGSKGAVRDGWALIAPQLDASTRPCNLVMHLSRLTEK